MLKFALEGNPCGDRAFQFLSPVIPAKEAKVYMLSDSICELWKVQGMKKQSHVAKYLSEHGYPLVDGQAISGGRIDDFLEALPNINRDSDIIVHWGP